MAERELLPGVLRLEGSLTSLAPGGKYRAFTQTPHDPPKPGTQVIVVDTLNESEQAGVIAESWEGRSVVYVTPTDFDEKRAT
jgi:hypothetical protein